MRAFLREHPRLVWAMQLILALAAAAVGWLQLERSAGSRNDILLALAPPYLLLGLLTAFAIPFLVYVLCGRWPVATGVGGAVLTLFALVNYYVRMLHGSALLAADIANAATAADVVGAYDIRPDATSVKLGLCFLPVLAIVAVQAWLGWWARPDTVPPTTWRSRLRRWGCGVIALFALFFFGYFGPVTVMPTDLATLASAISFNFNNYGYTPSLVSSVLLLLNPVVKPDGYLPEVLDEAAARAAAYTPAVPEADAADYPDIILILNESLYDPQLVTDLQTDAPYMDVLHGLSGQAATGYALVPDVGGGTNRSEFSLLASHSMTLMPGLTPFATMPMDGQPSAVTYLQALGYTTMAAHPAEPENYRRGVAWPALGFEETYFFEYFLPHRTPYSNRTFYVTDDTAYPDFIAAYESMPEEQPRFAYLLTIQNHGGYEDVADTDLLVRDATDYGGIDHAMDEYLSCLALDDQALASLMQYFTNLYNETGRRVVLAMAGDHAPYMVDPITRSDLTGTDRTVRQRSTPLLLWTNYPAGTRVSLGTADSALPVVDLCAVFPLAAEQAGLPLSPYYRYILAMRTHCAAWTNLGGALLPDGTFVPDGADAEIDSWLAGYYALEYNALTSSVRQDTLFLPDAG